MCRSTSVHGQLIPANEMNLESRFLILKWLEKCGKKLSSFCVCVCVCVCVYVCVVGAWVSLVSRSAWMKFD